MPFEVLDLLESVLGIGLDGDDLSPTNVLARATVIYIASVILVKMGSRRIFGRSSLFDSVVAIMLGSIMSRGILGTSPLLETIIAGAALIGLHWIFATISLYASFFGPMVKGHPITLIKDGEIQEEEMHRARISKNDLIEAIRLQAMTTDPSTVHAAYLERNGKISIIPSASAPRILETTVNNGVQTVRIQLE